MAEQQEKGNRGEDEALQYLREHGFRILNTNWRFKKEEVDIIAENDQWLVIVEVKTRSGNDYGEPQEFVSKKKQRLLIKAANAYVEKYDIQKEVRFDIIAITLYPQYKIVHIDEAFYP